MGVLEVRGERWGWKLGVDGDDGGFEGWVVFGCGWLFFLVFL